MKRPTLFITAIIGSFAFTQNILAATSAKDFIQKASVANEFETESSKLALDKSQNKDIKLFAQHMVTAHTKIGDDLQSVLQSAKPNIKVDNNLDADHQRLMKKLEGESGDTFNQDYVTIQLKAHKEAVSLFTDYSKSGDDKALTDFATTTLPTMEEHLQEIQKIQAKQ